MITGRRRLQGCPYPGVVGDRCQHPAGGHLPDNRGRIALEPVQQRGHCARVAYGISRDIPRGIEPEQGDITGQFGERFVGL